MGGFILFRREMIIAIFADLWNRAKKRFVQRQRQGSRTPLQEQTHSKLGAASSERSDHE